MVFSKPLVSIVVPVYKVEPYLRECVDSIFAQTYHNWELILVDDGSPDSCGAICDEYAARDGRTTVIHQENRGLGPARNSGYDASHGEYLCFIDSDDTVAPDYLEKLVDAAEREQADFAVSAIQTYEHGTGTLLAMQSETGYIVSFGAKTRNILLVSWAKLFRLSFLKKYNIRFGGRVFSEDMPYAFETNLLSGRIAEADAKYFYRIRPSSIMTTPVRTHTWPYREFEDAVRKVGSILTDPDDRQISEYIAVKYLCGFLTLYSLNECRESRKTLCDYTARIFRQYFPELIHNPYIFGKKRGTISGIPAVHRYAVQLCVLAYRLHLLYPFSALTAFVLRILRRE